MPLSWVVRDALGQFNVLVARKGQLSISDTAIRPTARNSDLTVFAPPGVGNPQALTETDVRLAIKSLQQFLLSVTAPEDVTEVCQHFMTLAKQYEPIDHNKAPPMADGKSTAPSTTDKKETIDDKKDASVTFLILDTMCSVLSSVIGLEGAGEKKCPLFRIDQRVKTTTKTLYRIGGTGANAAASPTSNAAGPVVINDIKPVGIASCAAVIPFAFAYLQHIYSPAVRNAAARLLGILSITFLDRITGLFIAKFADAKKDQAKREFATYQRAVGFLDFRVNTPQNVKITLDYLTALLAEMKNVDRGVLRQEICASLDSIYTKILSSSTPDSARREVEWSSFMRGEKGVEDWNVLYERVFTLVAKWAGKSKHMLFCYELLAHMVVFSRNAAFYQSKKRFDIVNELIKGIKNEKGETRRELMKTLARNYLNHLPTIFLQLEPNEFQNSLRQLFPALLPKKTKPIVEEIPFLLELITAAGRKNLVFFIHEIAIDILKPQSSYYSRQKALLLQSLGKMMEEDPIAREEMSKYYLQMGPLISPYIEDSASNPHLYHESSAGDEEDKQILLLRAALKCFPYIRHPKMEHVQVTAAAVIMLCKHDDREISGAVSQALVNFIQLDLNQFFLPTIHTLIDLLKLDHSIDFRPDQILKICNTISLLCNTLGDHLKKQEEADEEHVSEDAEQKEEAKQASTPTSASSSAAAASSPANFTNQPPLQHFQVTPQAWLSLREHLEAVVLMRLCHYEGWVRSELLRMLKSFSRPAFRAFEQSIGPGGIVSPTSAGGSAVASPSKQKADLFDVPYLIDYLLPHDLGLAPGSVAAKDFSGVILPTQEIFYKSLFDCLQQQHDKFAGIFSYAFSFLHKSLEEISKTLDQNKTYSSDLVMEEWYLFFRNQFLFCCLAVRQTTLVGESVEGVLPKEKASGGSSAAVLISAHDLALKFTNSRPRLRQYQARVHEVYTFYENIITFLQHVPTSQQNLNAQALMTLNSSPQSSGMYLVKLNLAKDLSQIRTGSPSGGDAASSTPQAHLSNWVELSKHLRKSLSDLELALAAQAQAQAAAAAGGGSAAKEKKVKKSAMQEMKFQYYFNEFTLHIFAAIFTQLTQEEYHQESNLLTKCLDDFIGQWISLHEANQLDYLRTLPIRTRLHSATLISRFLSYRIDSPTVAFHRSHMSKFEVLRRRAFFFQLLTYLMPTTQENAARQAGVMDKESSESFQALESGVLVGIVQVLTLDPLQDQNLEGQILYFLERLLILHQKTQHISSHLHQGVSACLNIFLKLNPKYVNEFIRMSMSETHAHLEAAEQDAQAQQAQAAQVLQQASAQAEAKARKEKGKQRQNSMILSKDERQFIHRESHPQFRPVGLVINRYYLRSCATNWTQDLVLWKKQHGFSLARMLAVALLAQTSADPESRAIGTLLAADLEKNVALETGRKEDEKPIKGSGIRLYSHESPFMFLEAVQKYSTSLAQQSCYLTYILPLLQESVILFEYISPSKKEALLRILLPWIYEITHLFLSLEEQHAAEQNAPTTELLVKNTCSQLMSALTDLTRLSYKSSILTESLKAMWITLLSNENLNERFIQNMTLHFVDEYHLLLDASDKQKQAQIEKSMVATGTTPKKGGASSTYSLKTPLRANGSTAGTASSSSAASSPLSPTSPTNLANITSQVTNAGGAGGDVEPPVSEAPAKSDDSSSSASSAAATVGHHAVSLTVESTPVEVKPVPSPTHDGSLGVARAASLAEDGPEPSPSPSPDASASVASAAASDILLRQSSTSVRATLDAGGLARVQASAPLTSPSSNLNAQSSAAIGNSRSFLERNLAKEKVLRKFILIQFIRSPVAIEILALLTSALRTYQDQCPLDPDHFLRFQEQRAPSTPGVPTIEPLTLNERSVFELLSNAVFENRQKQKSISLSSDISDAGSVDGSEDENGDLFHQYYPLLLQNAYVLFADTPEGCEMLVHLALALGLYDYNTVPGDGLVSSRETKIRSEKLIPLIIKTYPQLRHTWSKLTLIWACNTLDSKIAEQSWKLWMELEDSSFFFGEQCQEALIKAQLMLFHCLKLQEDGQMKYLISTLISHTAYPYDKQGWTSLVSSGWSLLVMSSIPYFKYGLLLLQHMFSLSSIPSEEQRKWILSLGRFLCKDSGQEVDVAIVDVLFKGLVSAQTFQPTLILLQSMATIYSGATLLADNKLVVLLMLVNIMQRMMDVEKMRELIRKRTSESLGSEAATANDSPVTQMDFQQIIPTAFTTIDRESEKLLIRGVDDCVNLSLLLHQYSTTEAKQQTELNQLANIFKNVALSLSRLLPDAFNPNGSDESDSSSSSSSSAPADPAASSSKSNWTRQQLFKKMVTMIETSASSASQAPEEDQPQNPYSNVHSPRSKKEELDGLHLPNANQLSSQFFILFTRYFESSDNFQFILIWFQRMLQHAPQEWKVSLLTMLGHFILESTHFPDNKQFQILAEIITQSYFAGSGTGGVNAKEESNLAEQIAYLLIEKRPNGCNLNRHTDLFNFVRPRSILKKQASIPPTTSSLSTGSSSGSLAGVLVTDATGRYDPQSELRESLARFEAHTFPILKQMASNPRQIQRPMDEASAAAARQAHARSSSMSSTAVSSSSSSSSSALPLTRNASASQYAKRLSFATLNDYSNPFSASNSSTGSNDPSTSSLHLPIVRERGASQSQTAGVSSFVQPAALTTSPSNVASEPGSSSPSPPAPAPPRPSPQQLLAALSPAALSQSTNPFNVEVTKPAPEAEEQEEEFKVEQHPPETTPTAAAAVPVTHPPSTTATTSSTSYTLPAPTRHAPKADSDSDDDAAIFAAATRKLSGANCGAPAGGTSGPPSRRSSISPVNRRMSDSSERGGRFAIGHGTGDSGASGESGDRQSSDDEE